MEREDDDMHIAAIIHQSKAFSILLWNGETTQGVLPSFSSICCNDGIYVIVTLTLY